MAATLKWDGDRLMLGKTKMAEVEHRPTRGGYVYVLGRDEDFVSEGYQEKADARQDCWLHVCRLMKKAGA
jgi:hypothetical protein